MSENQSEDFHPHENQENEMMEEIILNADINKSANNLDMISKKLKKGHSIFSEEENKTYFLDISDNNDKIKLLLSEQDIFPAKTYEMTISLQNLQSKYDFLSHYSSSKELSEELKKSDTNLKFNVKKKSENIITLIICLSNEENQNIEIDLNENIIDDRELFRQLFEKYKSIQQEQKDDITQFMTRIQKIEELLASQAKQKEQNEEEKKAEEEKAVEEKEADAGKNGEEQEQEPKQNEEVIKKEENDENMKKEEEKLSNKQSVNSLQKGKNDKKGKVEKKNEKGKGIGEKKNERGKVEKKNEKGNFNKKNEKGNVDKKNEKGKFNKKKK